MESGKKELGGILSEVLAVVFYLLLLFLAALGVIR
jgi:hypothetical protein